MKNKSLIITLVILVAIIAVASIAYPALSEKATEETTSEQTSTQDIKYPEMADIKIFDNTGKEMKLSDFKGKPIILNFWASWCGYCIQEMPDFEKAYKEYGEEIQFLIVNTDDGIAKGESFIKDKGYSFPTYYDLEYSAAITYGITGIPRTIAIDKDGFIRYNRSGMIDSSMLESIIETIR